MDALFSSAKFCGLITDYVFINTPLGIAAFTAGFLLSLWYSAKSSNFSRFFLFAFIALSIYLLYIVPRRQEDRAPVLFAFASDMADAVFKGAIVLEDPFAPHRLSFQMRAFVRQGVQDPALKDRLSEFVHAHYLPALGMTGLRVWPGDPQVVRHYSPQAKTEWRGLSQDLLGILNSPASPWPAAREYLFRSTETSSGDLDDQALRSLVQYEVGAGSPGPLMTGGETPPLLWKICGWVFAVFPYMYSIANASLGIVFPFTLLAMLFTCDFSFLTAYARNFIWIKSWVLGGALCHFASLAMASAQARQALSAAWFWEYPTYAVFGALLLCLMPLMTFLLTRRKTWTHST
ncbi:MAG: hypothetical protein Q7K71_04835 [Candidatus Omnitrophota bacterium]|nr:hypothetical protein [Candidatus Omnitrophota bacterium]